MHLKHHHNTGIAYLPRLKHHHNTGSIVNKQLVCYKYFINWTPYLDMEINEYQHPDFIWTWKTNKRSKKVGLWLPYLQSIEKLPKGKSDRYRFAFNGGEVTCHLKEIDFLMFYGATGSISIELLDKLATYKIPLLIHRRNMTRPYVFYPSLSEMQPDILTRQIRARENQIRRAYIARTLIHARFKSMEEHIVISRTDYQRLAKLRSLGSIRALEAKVTKRYWGAFYRSVGMEGTTRRDKNQKVNTALDAGSFFLFGVLLRWALFHKLSPCHGFLHEPTSYPSLCYDLMEPYRYLIENSVADACKDMDTSDDYPLTARSLQFLKAGLEEEVYVPATRQIVAEKNLLHGVVLALRSYLLGNTRRFFIPTKGIKKGGRPPKAGYALPGARQKS